VNQIVVLNAGGQYCHLIARRIRELGVHAVVADVNRPAADLRGARGIIISGGPASVTEPTSPSVDRAILRARRGRSSAICYGHQLARARSLGPRRAGDERRNMATPRCTRARAACSAACRRASSVWMSHGDTVVDVPPGFVITGETDVLQGGGDGARRGAGCSAAVPSRVVHTEHGTEI